MVKSGISFLIKRDLMLKPCCNSDGTESVDIMMKGQMDRDGRVRAQLGYSDATHLGSQFIT